MIRKQHLSSQLILLFKEQEWNIETTGQLLNWALENALIKMCKKIFKYSAGAHPKGTGCRVATLPGKPGNTWKYLEFILHLEKHLENSILGEIHLEIPGKMFSCCKKN